MFITQIPAHDFGCIYIYTYIYIPRWSPQRLRGAINSAAMVACLDGASLNAAMRNYRIREQCVFCIVVFVIPSHYVVCCRQPVCLAYKGKERRRRKKLGLDYRNLGDYCPDLNVEGDPDSGDEHPDDGEDDAAALRAFVEEAEDEQTPASGTRADKSSGVRNVVSDGCSGSLGRLFRASSDVAGGDAPVGDGATGVDAEGPRDVPSGSSARDAAADGCGDVVIDLGRRSRAFDNWLYRGQREPLASMGLYHYAMFVYETTVREVVTDFATYAYDVMHSECAKRVQKLRLDECFRVPRLHGITLPAETTIAKREQAALMKTMLFRPLSLASGCSMDGDDAVLEMLGDPCDSDCSDLSYQPEYIRWYGAQRALSDQFLELQNRAGKIFTLEDIDTALTGDMQLDDCREQPSSAEFMAHLTVQVATNMDLAASARCLPRHDPRPNPSGFESTPQEGAPSGGRWVKDFDDIRDVPTTGTQPAYPLKSNELRSASLLETFCTPNAYQDTFLKTMGACRKPKRFVDGSLNPYPQQDTGDSAGFDASNKRQQQMMDWKLNGAASASGDDPVIPRPRASTLRADVQALPDQQARIDFFFTDVDLTVQRLLAELQAEKGVCFGAEQMAFLARFVDHFRDVLIRKASGEMPTQRIFLLLGPGGCGKTELIGLLRDLVTFYHDVLTRHRVDEEPSSFPAVRVMASTNAAAVNVGGDTIHSSLKLTRHGGHGLDVLQRRHVTDALKTEWHEVYLLVIDELSLISPSLLTAASYVMCQARQHTWHVDPGLFAEKGHAFGGIPLVLLTGDFMQLPAFEGKSKTSLLGDPRPSLEFGNNNANNSQGKRCQSVPKYLHDKVG